LPYLHLYVSTSAVPVHVDVTATEEQQRGGLYETTQVCTTQKFKNIKGKKVLPPGEYMYKHGDLTTSTIPVHLDVIFAVLVHVAAKINAVPVHVAATTNSVPVHVDVILAVLVHVAAKINAVPDMQLLPLIQYLYM
jgi:hypothetical protein